jgi:hypothetical protein
MSKKNIKRVIKNTYDKKYEEINSINLLRKSDCRLYPVANTPFDFFSNLKYILRTHTPFFNACEIVKFFDYIVLYKHYFDSLEKKNNITIMKVIRTKLINFSNKKLFGPRRSKYYARVLFPEGKCIHISVYSGELCVYKKYKKFEYCRTHCEYIQSYSVFIKNNTTLCKDLVEIVVQYL